MPSHATQEQRILAVLQANFGRDVSLPDILSLRIAQYNARIKGLRRKGYRIQSRSEWIGQERHTWFRLVGYTPTPPQQGQPSTKGRPRPSPGQPAKLRPAPSDGHAGQRQRLGRL
ncbi:MAG: helix-turn-helix domain-containing protein [Acidobacteria bacterium]|nr:helix-turn-helix domain-containing protein [Acidobacteriota bacterium]